MIKIIQGPQNFPPIYIKWYIKFPSNHKTLRAHKYWQAWPNEIVRTMLRVTTTSCLAFFLAKKASKQLHKHAFELKNEEPRRRIENGRRRVDEEDGKVGSGRSGCDRVWMAHHRARLQAFPRPSPRLHGQIRSCSRSWRRKHRYETLLRLGRSWKVTE